MLQSLSSITVGVGVEVGLFLRQSVGVAEKVAPEGHWLLLPGHHASAFSGHVAVTGQGTMVPPGLAVGLCIIKYTDCTGGFSSRASVTTFSSQGEMDGYK